MIEILPEQRNDKRYGILVYFYWRDNNINPYIKGKVFDQLEDVEKFKLDFLSRLRIDEDFEPVKSSS
ncbi:hypothetical protein [Mastigocoleus testarum]|nr:hypothetical protein [Mastigocoleus testarum]